MQRGQLACLPDGRLLCPAVPSAEIFERCGRGCAANPDRSSVVRTGVTQPLRLLNGDWPMPVHEPSPSNSLQMQYFLVITFNKWNTRMLAQAVCTVLSSAVMSSVPPPCLLSHLNIALAVRMQ
jgi:hypothetical protein